MAKKENKKKETKSVQKRLRAHEMERRLETAAERDSSVAAFLQDFAKGSAASGDEAAYTNSFLSAIKALKPEIGQARKWAQKTIKRDLDLTDKELAMFQEKEKGEELVGGQRYNTHPNRITGRQGPLGPNISEPKDQYNVPGDLLPDQVQKYRQKDGVAYVDLGKEGTNPSYPTKFPHQLASLDRYQQALPRIARLRARLGLNDPSLRTFGRLTPQNLQRSGVPLAYDPNSPFRVRKNY